jgi:hypothetical protein
MRPNAMLCIYIQKIGECDEESVKLVKCAYDALKAAADMIKPGTMYRDLGCSIAQVLRL